MSNATLVDVDLRHARLNGVDLRGADLTGASLDGAFGGSLGGDSRATDQEAVKYDSRTSWPDDFRREDFQLGPGEFDVRDFQARRADSGNVIGCGNSCYQPVGVSIESVLVDPPDPGSRCHTQSWEGSWRKIATKDRRGSMTGGSCAPDLDDSLMSQRAALVLPDAGPTLRGCVRGRAAAL